MPVVGVTRTVGVTFTEGEVVTVGEVATVGVIVEATGVTCGVGTNLYPHTLHSPLTNLCPVAFTSSV